MPEGIDPEAMRHFLLSQSQVECVHDLHIWSLSSAGHDAALMAHLVRPGGTDAAWLATFTKGWETEFHIHHCTVQMEDGLVPGGCHSNCEAASV